MNRTALVTGGTRGIGLGIARALAAEGFSMAACGLRAPAAVEPVLAEWRAAGVEALYCRADITEPTDRAAMLDRIDAVFGGLNVLVNNAGVAPALRMDVTETTPESFDRVMNINLRGPFFLTQAVANRMIARKQADPAYAGCIINISSISATVASPSRAEYCLSKAGVSMMTRLWAVRLGEFDLPVYEIQPGVIRTDMTAGVQDKYDALIEQGLCLQSRWGLPEDIGRACAMLARGDLGYSTGQVIRVDGGLTQLRL